MTKVVIWGAAERRYEVQVVENGRIVGEYSAGNSIHESQASFPPGHRSAAPLSKMREWAEQTARETVQELIEDGEEAEYGGEDEDVTQNIVDLYKAYDEGGL